MPVYVYKCSACGESFENVLKVDDRRKHLSEPCPNCEVLGQVDIVIFPPKVVSGTGAFHSKIPHFFRDRLKEIKKTSGKDCTIDV